MAQIIPSTRFDTIRGGTRRRVSFAEFVELAQDSKHPKFVVESVIFPDLGEGSWGGFVVREGATKVLPRFRR